VAEEDRERKERGVWRVDGESREGGGWGSDGVGDTIGGRYVEAQKEEREESGEGQGTWRERKDQGAKRTGKEPRGNQSRGWVQERVLEAKRRRQRNDGISGAGANREDRIEERTVRREKNLGGGCA